jgi:signal-transduction protein with cAMP-binding, CBS, and nucleotidyltransferase domain
LKENYGEVKMPITASKSSTIREVITQLLETKIHRVWLAEQGKVCGVVSMSNILQLWSSWSSLFPDWYIKSHLALYLFHRSARTFFIRRIVS